MSTSHTPEQVMMSAAATEKITFCMIMAKQTNLPPDNWTLVNAENAYANWVYTRSEADYQMLLNAAKVMGYPS